jgi:hypothetical protein
MNTEPEGKPHHPYREGGKPKKDAPSSPLPKPAKNKSWSPDRKGQGGEGFSDGYGGSAGPGTGPSGPDSDEDRR